MAIDTQEPNANDSPDHEDKKQNPITLIQIRDPGGHDLPLKHIARANDLRDEQERLHCQPAEQLFVADLSVFEEGRGNQTHWSVARQREVNGKSSI